MRVLIAEDDLVTRVALAGILKKAGYEVLQAANGVEALDQLRQPDPPLLAVLDWMMPEMDGLEVLKAVRAQETVEPAYIVILTSKDQKSDVVEGLSSGANDYLAKPFDPAELLARVDVGRKMVDMQAKMAGLIGELKEALDHIKTLRGIVPICANCKKIRDDKGFWQQVEIYVHNHTEAEFSHGICPDCMVKLYPEYCKKLSPAEGDR